MRFFITIWCMIFIVFSRNVRGYMEIFKLFNVPFVYGAVDACSDYYKWIDFSTFML